MPDSTVIRTLPTMAAGSPGVDMPEVFQTAFSVIHSKCILTFNPGLAVKALGLTYHPYRLSLLGNDKVW